MGWDRTLETTPAKVGEDLKKLEAPSRDGEAAQMKAAIAVVEKLVPEVSKREAVLISIAGHTDPGAEGFDPRHLSVSVSRIDPEETKRAREQQAALRAAGEQHAAELEAEAARLREALPPPPAA